MFEPLATVLARDLIIMMHCQRIISTQSPLPSHFLLLSALKDICVLGSGYYENQQTTTTKKKKIEKEV